MTILSQKPTINENIVLTLIQEQFPEFEKLKIKKAPFNGIDNHTFCLGDDMLVRMPSDTSYASQVIKEQTWLPKLTQYLSTPIPKPIKLGFPNNEYPFNWSIYNWIPGKSANQLTLDNLELYELAKDLANFITELHLVPTFNAPAGGSHNYYRGCSLFHYHNEAISNIDIVKNLVDSEKLLQIWNYAITTQWQNNPVWIHGDLASGNILIENKKLSGVIDFGCTSIGDPACDLTIAWTYLHGQARETFKNKLCLDADTWARAKAWALWKATFELITEKDKASEKSLIQLRIIHDVISD